MTHNESFGPYTTSHAELNPVATTLLEKVSFCDWDEAGIIIKILRKMKSLRNMQIRHRIYNGLRGMALEINFSDAMLQDNILICEFIIHESSQPVAFRFHFLSPNNFFGRIFTRFFKPKPSMAYLVI